jgi:hypothetical protein
MSAAAPRPSVSSPPGRAVLPRVGDYRDVGPVRHDAVRANSWAVSGLAKVQGDVDVGSVTVQGLLSVGGKIVAGRLAVHGTLDAVGPVEVQGSLDLDGTARFDSPLHAGDLRAHGTLRGAGPVRVDRAFGADGSIEAPSIAAAFFDLTGGAEIAEELVVGGTARARFRADSRLGEVRAKRVEFHGPPTALVPTLMRRVFGGSAAIYVARIEAETVELSAVDVGFVRARQVVLGAGAQVTAVEGTIVRQHPSSHVGPESRSAPPHGLSR